MRLMILAIFLICTLECFSQKRNAGESVSGFIGRIKPDSTELAHPVIETAKEKFIVAYFTKQEKEPYLIGYLYIPTGVNSYKQVLIDSIYPEGGDPEIVSIFFANADKDRDKELIVICKYEQRHYDFSGAMYETFIYDYAKGETGYLDKLSKKFDGCECSWREGKTEKAKYKAAADVKAALKKMGY
jgi:hypothetical protein